MTKSKVNVAIRRTILALALAASACDLLPDPEFARIGDALKLKIAKVNRSESGTSAEFVFTVTNGGPYAVTACLGPSRSVSYDTSGPSGIRFTGVDHPGCMREFTIEPGQDMTWSEVLEVPHLSHTRVEVEVEVEVVNPRRCGGAGCTSTKLRSNKQRIQ
jgi:hypothetical protein